jgi:hypothetical protein
MKAIKKIITIFCCLGVIVGFSIPQAQAKEEKNSNCPQITSQKNVIEGIQVSWAQTKKVKNYRVYRRGAKQKWKLIANTKRKTYLDTKAKNGEYWKYSIQPEYEDSLGKRSNDFPAIKRLAPVKITSLKNLSNGIEVRWGSVQGAMHYKIYRRTSNKKWKLIKKISSNKFIDTSVKNSDGVQYKYAVRAGSGKHIGAYSGFEKITRQIPYVISVSSQDIDTMARLVYLEAGGEPYRGQVAVAEVIINRVKSSTFPNTVNGVVYQSGQFTPAYRISSTAARQEQYNAVYDALKGQGVLNNSKVVYFAVGNCCGKYYTTIGNHVFGTE